MSCVVWALGSGGLWPITQQPERTLAFPHFPVFGVLWQVAMLPM